MFTTQKTSKCLLLLVAVSICTGTVIAESTVDSGELEGIARHYENIDFILKVRFERFNEERTYEKASDRNREIIGYFQVVFVAKGDIAQRDIMVTFPWVDSTLAGAGSGAAHAILLLNLDEAGNLVPYMGFWRLGFTPVGDGLQPWPSEGTVIEQTNEWLWQELLHTVVADKATEAQRKLALGAATVFKSRTEEINQLLWDAVETGNWQTRYWALTTLSSQGDISAIALAVEDFHNHALSLEERRKAAWVVLLAGDDDKEIARNYIPAMAEVLRTPELGLERQAIHFMIELNADEVVPVLVEILASDIYENNIISHAVTGLWRLEQNDQRYPKESAKFEMDGHRRNLDTVRQSWLTWWEEYGKQKYAHVLNAGN